MSDDYHVVPGTVYMIDRGHPHHKTDSSVLLVPSPTIDTKDPLRWSRWRKAWHLTILVAYAALSGALANWQNPFFLLLAADTGTDLTTVNRGVSTSLLMTGFGNVIFTPLSYRFGRRFTYLSSLAVVLVSTIWMANVQSGAQYIGACVLQGLGIAPFEAMVAVSIADTFFVHERGSKIGLYVLGLNIGTNIGPICSGYIVQAQGWRWVYWWGSILTAIVWLTIFFTFEETRFVRSLESEGVTTAVGSQPDTSQHSATKPPATIHDESVPEHDTEDSQVTPGAFTHHVGQRFEAEPFRLQYAFYQSFPPTGTEFWRLFLRPFEMLWFPAVAWSGVLYGSCVGWLIVLGTTTAAIFSAPPYRFSNSELGLIWISNFIGSIFGIIYGGVLNDKFALYMARTNRGFREPEFRLCFFLPVAILMPGGLILYGAGSAAQLPWIAPVVGMGLVGFGLSVGGSIAVAYVLDCYAAIGGEALTAVMLIRNIIGFGLTFSVQPWIEGMGLRNTFILMGCLAFLAFAMTVLFLYKGKGARRLTSTTYLKMSQSVTI